MPAKAKTKVTMLMSVGAGALDVDEDYVAGEEYELDQAKADEYILKGYAEGPLSKAYTEEEKLEVQQNRVTLHMGTGQVEGGE